MNDIERIVIETEQRSKANDHRLTDLENGIEELRKEHKAIYELTASVKVIAERLGSIEKKVDETNKKVDETIKSQKENDIKVLKRISEVENQPMKQTSSNVNSLKMAVIGALCSAVGLGILDVLIQFTK